MTPKVKYFNRLLTSLNSDLKHRESNRHFDCKLMLDSNERHCWNGCINQFIFDFNLFLNEYSTLKSNPDKLCALLLSCEIKDISARFSLPDNDVIDDCLGVETMY